MTNRQIGQIAAVSASGLTATVKIQKTTMCSHGSCSHRLLPEAGQEILVEAENPIGAAVGDFVEISFETRAALWAAFAVYVLPIVIGLVFYVLAEILSSSYPWVWAMVFASATLALGLYWGNQLQGQCTITRSVDGSVLNQAGQDACVGCPFR